MRMPWSRARSTASTASCGPAISTDITAPAGCSTPQASARRAALACTRAVSFGVLVEHLDRGEGRAGGGGGEARVVDEGSCRVDQVLADHRGCEHGTALCRKGLRECRRDDDVLCTAAGRRDEPSASRADDPQGVRLVDDEDGAGLGGEGDEPLDGGGVAEHRVDRLGDDDGPWAVAAGEQLGDVAEVVVPGDRDGGPGQSAAVDEAGVGVLVADDERARVGERREDGEVRGVPAGEHQRAGGARQGREGRLESSWMSRVPVTRREAPAPVP